MIIHELTDDGVGIGATMVGATRCGADGKIMIRGQRRYVRTSGGAMFALSLLQSRGDTTVPFALETEPTTCCHCRRRAKR